jgi:peptidyl-prolyl cis-trans isomerase D
VLDSLRNKNKLGVRILLGIVVGMLGVGMLLYLVPQGDSTATVAEVVAEVGGQQITKTDVRQQLARIERSGAIPTALQGLYTQQVLNQLVFQKELVFEASRLGISVTDQERADRIRALVPTAFLGDTFVGMQLYAQQVLERTGMDVPEFEQLISQSLIEEKFQQLVTDGITVSPAEVEQEFRRRNEKVKLSYVVIKPDDLQSKIEASDADLTAYFEKNKTRYAVPERRAVRYAFLDLNQLRGRATVSDEEIRAAYNQNIDRYKIEDRAHVAHILFKTVGKTDAEVEETRRKAEEILKKAKAGANFADLAKESSEDTTKEQGGDLGWIVRGQTVPEFEKAAFSVPKGAISDVVKTQYGFHIIKVMDREAARTQPLEEVRPAILAALQQEKSERTADEVSGQMAEEIRRAGHASVDDLAKKFNLTVGDPLPLEAGQTIPEVGNSPEIADTIFRLRAGDLSAPIHTDRGYVVISVKEAMAAHPGTLTEVHDRVLADYRRDKSVELAKSRAGDLAGRGKAAGSDFAGAAKSLGFEAKTTDLVARTATIPDVGTASQLTSAFTLAQGQTSDAVFLGANWVVFRVVERQQPNPDDLAKQRPDITQQLLQERRQMAYDAFRTALEARLTKEGKLQLNNENIKSLTNSTS